MASGILLVSDFSYPLQGGTERHVVGIAKYLASKGNFVHVLTPAWKEKATFQYMEDGVVVHKFHTPFMRNFLIRSIAYLAFGAWISLKENISIIHSFYTLPAIIPCAFLAKITSKKNVLTFFEWELLDMQRGSGWKYALTKCAFLAADCITTLSWILERKIKKVFPGKKIITVTNWLDEELFKVQRPLKSASRKNSILFMGRLSEDKGIYVLLDALGKIKGEVDFSLTVAGPPIEQVKFKKKAGEIGIINRIKFAGFVPEKSLAKLYSDCDILVLPSIRREGMGFVLIEAMAYGKPVIGSTDGGIPDAVGEGGIIVEKNNPVALSLAIKKLLLDNKEYAYRSKEAIKRVKEVFSAKKVLAKYVKIYGGILK